jgi:hypothetical protein
VIPNRIGPTAGTLPAGATLTRVAESEHTIANGFNEDIFYYGDSVGNLYVCSESSFGTSPCSNRFTVNLPTGLNAFGSLQGDDQVAITGLGVEPVADLTSFSNVNGSFGGFAGQTGEILYVTFDDGGGGGLRLAGGESVRSGLLAFPVDDTTSPPPSAPGIISPTDFPVTVGGSFGVFFSTFDNLAGLAVDGDGSVYVQQVDLQAHTGANIVKITSADSADSAACTGPCTPWHDRSLAESGFVTASTLNPANGSYGTSAGPINGSATQVNVYTNYSGTSTFFGNIAALAAGPTNVLYAAVARSAGSGGTGDGPFHNPSSMGDTPNLIISFADTTGTTATIGGVTEQEPDGFADAVSPGVKVRPGFNNYRVFARGDGPTTGIDRGDGPTVSFDVDYDLYSGLTVGDDNTVYVISGGTPAGVGANPSPTRGEILAFPDARPYDREADYVDVRGETLPNPPNGGPNVGNGKSDRIDHLFAQAPLDPVTGTPEGLAGLAHGFLAYLNRPGPNTPANVPTSAQAANSTSGPITFDDLDSSLVGCGGPATHQVAGGDKCSGTTGKGTFVFNGAALTPTCTGSWSSFFLNSNGSVSLNAGDPSGSPTVSAFSSGPARIAPAWAALDTGSRTTFANTFPVQAMGFAGPNEFLVEWIDVPQTGLEADGSSNTFSVDLYDSTQTVKYFSGGKGAPLRPVGSAQFTFDYGHTDLFGSSNAPVIAGVTQGDTATVPAINLSKTPPAKTIGVGHETEVYESFAGSTNQFDLRAQTNYPVKTIASQKDSDRDSLNFTGTTC